VLSVSLLVSGHRFAFASRVFRVRRPRYLDSSRLRAPPRDLERSQRQADVEFASLDRGVDCATLAGGSNRALSFVLKGAATCEAMSERVFHDAYSCCVLGLEPAYAKPR
jgi:hypothetical protein